MHGVLGPECETLIVEEKNRTDIEWFVTKEIDGWRSPSPRHRKRRASALLRGRPPRAR